MYLILSQEQLDTLRELSKNSTSLRNCAAILEVEFADLLDSYHIKGNPVQKTYDGGWLEGLDAVKSSVQSLAANGSATAQMLYLKLSMQQELANYKDFLDEL